MIELWQNYANSMNSITNQSEFLIVLLYTSARLHPKGTCCCLPTPFTLVNGGGGGADLPTCDPPVSSCIYIYVCIAESFLFQLLILKCNF